MAAGRGRTLCPRGRGPTVHGVIDKGLEPGGVLGRRQWPDLDVRVGRVADTLHERTMQERPSGTGQQGMGMPESGQTGMGSGSGVPGTTSMPPGNPLQGQGAQGRNDRPGGQLSIPDEQ